MSVISYKFESGFSNFSEALTSSQSYEEEVLIDALIDDRNNFESGSKIIGQYQQILSAIAMALARLGLQESRPLRILDFGGGLGEVSMVVSHHFPYKGGFIWDVLETPAMANAGMKNFQSSHLNFYSSINDVCKNYYDIILASGALQYLPAPADTFKMLGAISHKFFIVNRFPILIPSNRFEADRITVQRIERTHGKSSYPAWFFSLARWQSLLFVRHKLLCQWDVPQDGQHQLDSSAIGHSIGALLELAG